MLAIGIGHRNETCDRRASERSQWMDFKAERPKRMGDPRDAGFRKDMQFSQTMKLVKGHSYRGSATLSNQWDT